MPEEETFAVLVKIMQDYRMREMFKPSMAELGLCMYQLDMLVQEHIPGKHLWEDKMILANLMENLISFNCQFFKYIKYRWR